MYADFDFYTAVYQGSILTDDNFSGYAVRASAYIDYCTLGRAKKQRHKLMVALACCALAEQYLAIDTAMALSQASLSAGVTSVSSASSGELASQTVGGWSKSYRSGGDSAKSAISAVESAQTMLGKIAEQYLGATGLLVARGYHA